MEEFKKTFVDSQDFQIEGLVKVLEEYKLKYRRQDEGLRTEQGKYLRILEKTNSDRSQMAGEVKVVFDRVDEYLRVVEKMERVVDNAERDLRALEEYCLLNK